MSINIEQLDSEERNKIRALVRERNDKDKDKGVDYIFRQHDDKEQYLLGKKLDINQMAKDDKALMGESEAEFQERMEHRKKLEKMREDPMSIIQMNDQLARKIAIEKRQVHDRLNDKKKSRNRRMSSSSDSESSDDIMDQLRAQLAKYDEDDENPIGEFIPKTKLNQKAVVKSFDYNKKTESRHRQKSRSRDQRRPQRRSRSPIDRKRRPSNERQRKRSRSRDNRKRQSRSPCNRRRSGSRSRHNKRSRSKEQNRPNITKNRKETQTNYGRAPTKSKLSAEEKQQRLEEMKQNGVDHNLRCALLESKYQKENELEAVAMDKHLKNLDTVMINQTIKMHQNLTLEKCLEESRKQSMVKRMFKN